MRPSTVSADPSRPLPESAAARLDQARAALATLRHEHARLLRLGFEEPLARCEEQIRYWSFVAGLLALPREAEGRTPWPGPR